MTDWSGYWARRELHINWFVAQVPWLDEWTARLAAARSWEAAHGRS